MYIVNPAKGIYSNKELKMIWVYCITTSLLALGNAFQLGKGYGTVAKNVFQVIVYEGSAVAYGALQPVTSPWFYFSTGLLFVLAFAFECMDLSKKTKGERNIWDFLWTLLTFAPIVFDFAMFCGIL